MQHLDDFLASCEGRQWGVRSSQGAGPQAAGQAWAASRRRMRMRGGSAAMARRQAGPAPAPWRPHGSTRTGDRRGGAGRPARGAARGRRSGQGGQRRPAAQDLPPAALGQGGKTGGGGARAAAGAASPRRGARIREGGRMRRADAPEPPAHAQLPPAPSTGMERRGPVPHGQSQGSRVAVAAAAVLFHARVEQQVLRRERARCRV